MANLQLSFLFQHQLHHLRDKKMNFMKFWERKQPAKMRKSYLVVAVLYINKFRELQCNKNLSMKI